MDGKFAAFGLSLSNEDPAPATVELVRRADALGFDEVSLPESRHFRSVFAVAAASLVATDRARVRIGIANPVTRHPAVLAMEAATLAELGPGRLVFGVGAAVWTMAALGYAPPGWKPYTHTLETIRALRAWLGGQALGFTPTTFAALPHTRLDFTPPPGIPIELGAVSARMMEAGGEVADGVQLGALTSARYVTWARERIAAGAARVGREGGGIRVSANILLSVDRDRAAARRAVRDVLAYYLARVEGVVVDESGADPADVAAVRDAVGRGGVGAGRDVVSDDLVRVFAVAGTVDDVLGQLAPYAAAGLDVPLAWHTFGPDRAAAIETLAHAVRPALVREAAGPSGG